MVGPPLILFALGVGVSTVIATVAAIRCILTPAAPHPAQPLPSAAPTSDPTVVPVDTASDPATSAPTHHHWKSHKSRPWGARPSPTAPRPPDA